MSKFSRSHLTNLLPGIALASFLGAGALLLAKGARLFTPHVPDVMAALVLGACLVNTPLGGWLKGARFEPGLQFTGKWLLRVAVILSGLQVSAGFLQLRWFLEAAAVLLLCLPATFFMAQWLARRLRIGRPMGDLVSIGTMVCGASAINGLAPVIGAHRKDQGIAVSTAFLFSVVALVVFYPVAKALHLPDEVAGLWSGLAVNDFSSAVALGTQFSESAGAVATASKSMRVLLLGPLLVAFSLWRRGGRKVSSAKQLASHIPLFVVGYVLLLCVRAAGDAAFGGAAAWAGLLAVNEVLVKGLIIAVCAGIGLQLDFNTLRAVGGRSVAVGAVASATLAGLSLAMLYAFFLELPWLALGTGSVALLVSGGLFFGAKTKGRETLIEHFAGGKPLSLTDAVQVLEIHDEQGTLNLKLAQEVLRQLQPTQQELLPIAVAPIPESLEYARVVYWESPRGRGSLVGIRWPPRTRTHIHSHQCCGVGKTMQGELDMVEFERTDDTHLRVCNRMHLSKGMLLGVTGSGAATIHAIRNTDDCDAIDLHFYGPHHSSVCQYFEPMAPLHWEGLTLGTELPVKPRVADTPVVSVDSRRWRGVA